MMVPTRAPDHPSRQSKAGHFLSAADKTILDAGPDPFASLDRQRKSEKQLERQRHQKRHSQVHAQTITRSQAALDDLWWATDTLDAPYARRVYMREVRAGILALEFLVYHAMRRLAWEQVPSDAGGQGEFFAERIARALADAMSTPERRVRVQITLEGTEGPLSQAPLSEPHRASRSKGG